MYDNLISFSNNKSKIMWNIINNQSSFRHKNSAEIPYTLWKDSGSVITSPVKITESVYYLFCRKISNNKNISTS